MENLRIFITGATGFVGSNLLPELTPKYKVTCLVRNREKGEALKKCFTLDYVIGDITDSESLKSINPEEYDVVIHLAAMGHVSATSEEAFNLFTGINEGGTKNLIEVFSQNKNLRSFIHFSSTAAMGPIEIPILNEESKPNPVTPYQKSKLRSEEYSIGMFKQIGFPTIVIRPCMIYGIGGYGEFHKFCRLMKKGVFPKVGLGKNLTPLVHVKDVVQGTMKAIEYGKPGEVYLITSADSIPMDTMHKYIMKAIGKKGFYPFVPAWVAYAGAKFIEFISGILKKEPIVTYRNIRSTVVDRTFDISKARRELHYEPKIDFESGIKETVDWYKSNNRL